MLKGNTNEERIWNYLIDAGLNAYGAAGLMGNLYAESGLNPMNLQNTFEKKLGYMDKSYTKAVDNGRYSNFARDGAGYGLCQWTYWSRKEALLYVATTAGKSVGDLEVQLDFILEELTTSYASLFRSLKAASSVKTASDLVVTKYERPADQSEAAKKRRVGYGQAFYDKFAAGPTKTTKEEQSMTENELRKKVVSIAQSYLGCKESNGSHRKIIDLYNSHKPLARGYVVKYTDAWCSTFASAVAIKAGLTDIIPTECGCEKHIQRFKKLGSWQENDAYVPKPGDYIFYDWNDKGTGDCTGSADHVGIVVSVSGKTIQVIEGNKSNAVGYRKIAVNGRYIRGYGVPNYASKAGSSTTASQNTTNSGGTAKTYTVKSGDSLWAIATKQLGSGSRYKEIKALNGLKSNVIHPGQVLKLPD